MNHCATLFEQKPHSCFANYAMQTAPNYQVSQGVDNLPFMICSHQPQNSLPLPINISPFQAIYLTANMLINYNLKVNCF